MEIKGIKYAAPFFDGSGYAQAARSNVAALNKKGIPLTLSPVSFDQTHPNLGEEGEFLKSLVNKDIDYNIIISHMLPRFWSQYKEPNKTTVGYTIWETTKLPVDWVPEINEGASKVLVGSTWNVEVFENSGVTIPIGVVPHGIDAAKFDDVQPFQVAGIDKDAFVYYSIFQWTERKNPLALIKAYWYAFQNNENVALVLKTYRNSYDDKEKNVIRDTIKNLKSTMNFSSYPKIYLVLNMLSDEEMMGLHKRGDCYVSTDRGEGFGLCPFAAAAAGNPIIVPNFGGVREFADVSDSFLIDCFLEPVSGMAFSPWYTGDQLWAYPSISHAAEHMRNVYENQDAQDTQSLKEKIINKFNWDVIGDKLVAELEAM